ncbi:uncharacterized protein B0T15DRAFT_510038 [Chaetomium strumarium]|uniref:Uncharacterized protein n=1 Tax=Chaetomium strumarium TaxID=1170767 RepID=A0AAJ0GV17_9PEZI|nr:hypothetical protein B0T15DRAFT_510038 [Chaetomium strumarium]
MAPTDTFTITAGPGTDIWRKPPTTDVFNAPTALPPPGVQPLRNSGPLTSFLSARISFNFTAQEQYDQGGILLSFFRRNADKSANKADGPPPKWIKSGIEFYNGAPRLSTVSCDNWADWSVADLNREGGGGKGKEIGWTTIQIEKDKDGNGTGVWVYRVVEETGEKIPLREICWVFGDSPEEWEVEVYAMAARPEKEVDGGLVVEFAGFEVKWKD